MTAEYFVTRDNDRDVTDNGLVRAIHVHMIDGDMPPQSIEDPVLESGELLPGYWVLVRWDAPERLGVFHPVDEPEHSMSEGQAADYLANGYEL